MIKRNIKLTALIIIIYRLRAGSALSGFIHWQSGGILQAERTADLAAFQGHSIRCRYCQARASQIAMV